MGRLAQTFGANVRRLRLAKGLSQEALADTVELAVTYVGQIERGRRNPTLDVVERFATVLGVDPAGAAAGLAMEPHPAAGAVLLLIDLQQAIDDPSWGERNNPQAEANVVQLLAAWRAAGWPVWHVRHDSREPASPYRPDQPGHDWRQETAPLPGEKVVAKQTNSAFIGTSLEAELRAAGHERLVVAGVITNNSVEATVRMAGNLGFQTWLLEDACFTFARTDWRGAHRTADEVHAMNLANLDGEYCSVVGTREVLEGSPARR